MKKLLFVFILAISMVLTSCDRGCYVKPVNLKNPEVQAYNMYLYGSDNNYNYNRLYVFKYDTPEAYIYRYVISGETRNIDIVPKHQSAQQHQDTESILSKSTYFDY